jgi:hypothetical protein
LSVTGDEGAARSRLDRTGRLRVVLGSDTILATSAMILSQEEIHHA